MLDIIICEDSDHYRLRTYTLVNDFLKKTNIKYSISTYRRYNDKLKKYIKANKSCNKIYLLDICLEENHASGIDIANDIRAIDFESLVVVITGKTGLLSEAQKLRLNLFDYVCKQISYDTTIEEILASAIKVFEIKKSIKFSYNRNDYNIRLNEILYIKSDKSIRKTIVATKDSKFEVSKPLCFFEDQVGQRFIKTCRGCVVNMSNVKMADYETGSIVFHNNEKLVGVISAKNISKVKEAIRSVE